MAFVAQCGADELVVEIPSTRNPALYRSFFKSQMLIENTAG
jgi:hypothetical protein